MFKHRIQNGLRCTAGFAKRHRGEIIYYGGVLLALGALAWGAEQYRIGREETQMVLPAAEIVETAPQEEAFTLPEGMDLARAYSAQPQWNERDQSWQAHPAADYSCADGDVRALSAGTVVTVGESGVLGGFVELQAGEYLLRYCSIVPAEKIAPGAVIEKGDIIGTAENAMPGENHLGAHLHLEAYRQGESIDPQQLFENAD